MKKISILISCLLSAAIVFAQKLPNPKIYKSESEITLINFRDERTRFLGEVRRVYGGQFVYRLPLRKDTKAGLGVLVAADKHRFNELTAYGAVFADVTQFIGKRQKWSLSWQAGHGIYKQKSEYEDATGKAIDKHIGGMYYSVSVNYRAIVSRKTLIIISPFLDFRNIRHKTIVQYYSPSAIEKTIDIEKYSGIGLRLGVVF